MKSLAKTIKLTGLFLCLLLTNGIQAQDDSTKPEISVNLRYFSTANSLQWLLLETKIKQENRFQPLGGQPAEIYMDSIDAANLVAKTKTDETGKSKIFLSPSLKDQWNASPVHKFIVTTPATPKQDATENEFSFTRAKISIDTANSEGARSVTAEVMKFENGNWVPVKDVEVKLAIKRLASYLQIGEEESYTTDSLGQVSGEFKKDSIPGDSKGMITLVARVEDNDQLGNLMIEKTVAWGNASNPVNNFGARSLWATRDKAPIWLLLMAYSIIAGVWGVIIYLVIQVIRLIKLGKKQKLSQKQRELQYEVFSE